MIMAILIYFSFARHSTPRSARKRLIGMAEHYIEGAAQKTGSANLVTGVVFDFRGYDTWERPQSW